MKYKTVIFDVDGTLFDTSGGIFNCINYVLTELGLETLQNSVLRKFVGPPVDLSFQKICGMNAALAEKAAALYRKYYVEQFVSQSVLYNGMLELLILLKENNIKTGIATMKTQPQADKLIDLFHLGQFFDCVAGVDLKHKLPKSGIIKNVLKAVGCANGAHAVMIGDTASDGEGARVAGVDFIGVTYGFGISGPDDVTDIPCSLLADTVQEIKAFLL